MKEHQPTWSAVSLNPPFVYGPLLLPPSSPKDLNDSIEIIYTFCSSVKPREFLRPRMRFDDWIDVRDCADLHVQAASLPAAAGRRFIINKGPLSDNQIARIIVKHFPAYAKGVTDKPGWNEQENEQLPKTSSTKNMEEVFDRTQKRSWIGLEQSIQETVESIEPLLRKAQLEIKS